MSGSNLNTPGQRFGNPDFTEGLRVNGLDSIAFQQSDKLTLDRLSVPSILSLYQEKVDSYTTPTITDGSGIIVDFDMTPKKVRGFDFDDLNNRWYFDVPDVVNREFILDFSASTLSGNGRVVEFELYKNGVLEDGVWIERKFANATDVGSIAGQGLVDLSSNDYIEIWIGIVSGGDSTVTLTRAVINLIPTGYEG